MDFSISAKYIIRILRKIALNPWISLGSINMLTTLSPPIREHRMSAHLCARAARKNSSHWSCDENGYMAGYVLVSPDISSLISSSIVFVLVLSVLFFTVSFPPLPHPHSLAQSIYFPFIQFYTFVFGSKMSLLISRQIIFLLTHSANLCLWTE